MNWLRRSLVLVVLSVFGLGCSGSPTTKPAESPPTNKETSDKTSGTRDSTKGKPSGPAS
jgi:hypothetical protein